MSDYFCNFKSRFGGKFTVAVVYKYKLGRIFNGGYFLLVLNDLTEYSPLCLIMRCFLVLNECHRGDVTQWVALLTRNVKIVGSSPIKGPRCFLEQETLPVLLSTGWSQERIRA